MKIYILAIHSYDLEIRLYEFTLCICSNSSFASFILIKADASDSLACPSRIVCGIVRPGFGGAIISSPTNFGITDKNSLMSPSNRPTFLSSPCSPRERSLTYITTQDSVKL